MTVTVFTLESLGEVDQQHLREASAEFHVGLEVRTAPVGDEEILLVEHRDLDPETLRAMPRLHTILLLEYGRALLPGDLLRARGIVVRHVPNLAGLGVAEHTFALILALKKQLLAGHRAATGNVWRDDIAEPLYTDQRAHVFNWSGIPDLGWVFGETIGIVGFGRIGQAVARRALAFEMDVIYYSRHRVSPDTERRLSVRFAPLDELLRTADIVTLHLPFSAESEGLIGARELALMKPSGLLINVARGRVVDEDALIEALRTRAIAGAGLDVLTYEPPHPDNPILGLDNVIVTPHVAGVSSPIARREQFRIALRWAARAAE